MAAIRNIDDRPLTARSVLASALLGTEPPELPVAQLVSIAALFGLSENRTRVALSRMVAAGEATTDDGRYRLAGHLLARQGRQRQSRHPELRPWSGAWTAVVIAPGRRSAPERARTRRDLTVARLAEVREGLWVRPDNLPVDVVDAGLGRWRAEPEGDPTAMAAELWDLPAWAATATRLRTRLATSAPDLAALDTAALAPGFVLSASVLRHFQSDPLLPDEILPPDWPGAALRSDYDGWDAAYRHLLRQVL